MSLFVSNKAKTGPRPANRFKPEVHPGSKWTKFPEQEQLKLLLCPSVVGRRQKYQVISGQLKNNDSCKLNIGPVSSRYGARTRSHRIRVRWRWPAALNRFRGSCSRPQASSPLAGRSPCRRSWRSRWWTWRRNAAETVSNKSYFFGRYRIDRKDFWSIFWTFCTGNYMMRCFTKGVSVECFMLIN